MSDDPVRYMMKSEAPIAMESKYGRIIDAPKATALLTFHPDGRVTADPNLKPDEAARKIIALLVENGWFKFLPT